MRVMMRMFATTYGLSEISTPICEIGPPIGPIENGITYIVRPRIAPANKLRSVARIVSGSSQLLVGPASSWRREQMKVRSSTRATSVASERARYEFGRRAGLSLISMPEATISAQSRSYSASLPSAQRMRSGCVRVATSATQAARPPWRRLRGALIASGAYMRMGRALQTGRRRASRPTARRASAAYRLPLAPVLAESFGTHGLPVRSSM
jgi:hypothetical protein